MSQKCILNSSKMLVSILSFFYLIFFFCSCTNSESFRLKGVFKTNDAYVAFPLIDSKGIVYFVTDKKFYAIDSEEMHLEGCQPLWTYDIGVNWSPVLDEEGNVYIGSTGGVLYSFNSQTIDQKNPRPLWTYKVGRQHCAPFIIDKQGPLYVASDEHIYVFDPQVIDEKKPQPLWSYKTTGILSPPAMDSEGRIYFVSVAGVLLVFDPKKINAKNPEPISRTLIPAVSCAPLIDNQSKIYIGSSDGRLFVFDSDDLMDAKNNIPSPHIIYITDEDTMFAHTLMHSKEEIWFGSHNGEIRIIDFKTLNKKSSCKSYREEELYYFMNKQDSDSNNKNERRHFFKAKKIDREHPHPLWSYQTGGFNLFLNTSKMDHNGIVYVGSEDSKLYVFDPKKIDQGNPQPLWFYETGGPIRSAPSIDSRGNVYVGSADGNLYVFEKVPKPIEMWLEKLYRLIRKN